MRDTLIDSLTTDPPPATDPSLASRALALDAAPTATDGAAIGCCACRCCGFSRCDTGTASQSHGIFLSRCGGCR